MIATEPSTSVTAALGECRNAKRLETNGERATVTESAGVRRRSADRPREIVRAARRLFLDLGYQGAGMAELAAASDVSRGSIYRYFPAGRSDLFLAVAEDVVGELQDRLRYAAGVPFSPQRRLEHLLAAFFAFFQEEPRAYRLLWHDVWATGEPAVEASVPAFRSLLAGEIAGVIADVAATADEVSAASTGILGLAMANVELALSGAVEAETAWRVTCRYAVSQLPG